MLQVISFLLLMVLLSKILYRPVLHLLEQRRGYIREEIEKAEKEREEAEKKLKEAEQRLKDTQAQIWKWKESAQKEIEEERKKFLINLSSERRRMMEETREEIKREVNQARENLRREVGAISLDIAERILKREIREEDRKRLLKESLEKIKESEGWA